MRVVLHIGPMKTGTTALQESLASHRRELLTQGVLYPTGNNPDNRINHHSLSIAVLNEDQWNRRIWWGRHRDAASLRDRALSYWDSIRREIASHRPDTVVLSSEFFSWAREPQEWERLHALLSQVTDEIVPCLYIRDPADRWLSHFQQSARHSSSPRALSVARFRPQLEQIEGAFQTRPLVRAYERRQLIDGDIVRDFLTAVLGAASWSSSIASRASNEAMSPEVLAIVFDFRRVNYVGLRGQGGNSTGRLITDLQAVERGLPPAARLQLRPEIRAELTRGAIDLPWLRDEYGISFTGVDYEQDFELDALTVRPIGAVEEIVTVDHDRKRELLARLLHSYVTETRWTRVARDAATALTPSALLRDPADNGNLYDRAWVRLNRRRRWRELRRRSAEPS